MIGGKNQIFTIKPDGSGVTQLTDAGNNEDPSFSPDGRYIAFTSNRQGPTGIFVIRANGEGLKRLTPKGFRAASPGWSPL
jgi:TolB protein